MTRMTTFCLSDLDSENEDELGYRRFEAYVILHCNKCRKFIHRPIYINNFHLPSGWEPVPNKCKGKDCKDCKKRNQQISQIKVGLVVITG